MIISITTKFPRIIFCLIFNIYKFGNFYHKVYIDLSKGNINGRTSKPKF